MLKLKYLITEANIIQKIDKLAKRNKYGTVDGTQMNGKTAREIIAIFKHPKMNSFRNQMLKMKSHELVDLTLRLLKPLKIKVESVNEAVPRYKFHSSHKTLKSAQNAASKAGEAVIKKIKGKFIVSVMESVNEAKFSNDQIEILRKAYGTLSRMNPSSPTYKKFIKFLDKLPKDQLKQLAAANIKFVSMLAKNRLRGESVDEGGMGVLDKDQADVLQALVMRNKNKNSKAILSILMKNRMFKGIDKKELLGYIEGAKQFVKYMSMGRTGNESVNEAPMATRAIQKQLGSELNNVSDMIMKITNKYKNKAGIDGIVRAWMLGLHSRLKKSGVKI